METTFIDEKSVKSLEDYATLLTTQLISLITLQKMNIHALEIGILKDDQSERVNTMIWDMNRLLKSTRDQLESCLELLPDDFNASSTLEKLKNASLKKARSMTRKAKVPS